jgi:hypothetical protein
MKSVAPSSPRIFHSSTPEMSDAAPSDIRSIDFVRAYFSRF